MPFNVNTATEKNKRNVVHGRFLDFFLMDSRILYKARSEQKVAKKKKPKKRWFVI